MMPPREEPSPEIVLLPTTYGDLTIDESTAFPVALSSRFDHLDVDAGETAWIHFQVSEETSAEYRYLVNGAVQRDFGPPVLVALGVWGVPVAYQSLGPALAEAPGALHTIELRAVRGEASVVRRIHFTLEVTSPPVRLENCRLEDTLSAFDLDALTLHQLFDGHVPLVTADLRYPIEPVEDGLAPTAMPIIEAGAEVEVRVPELGLDKFPAWSAVDHPITGLSDAPDCPYAVPGGIAALFDGGVHEAVRVSDGARVCDISGPFPDHVSIRSTTINNPTVYTAQIVASRVGDLALELEVGARALEARFGGTAFDWSTQPELEPPYFAGAGPSRYYLPPDLGVHFTGTDRFIASANSPLQDLWFETRAFVQKVEIRISPLSLEASHPDLPHLTIDVERDASCAAPLVFASTATP